MNINDVKEDESIQKGEILTKANNILNLTKISAQIKRVEDLFSDEFYIFILINFLPDQKDDIKPGKIPQEKVNNLKILLKILSEVLEMDLSYISPEGIIMEHDKNSVISFLDFIEALIKTLLDTNLEEEEENELGSETNDMTISDKKSENDNINYNNE